MTSNDRIASLGEAKDIWRQARIGTLSVLDFETGGPLGALVNVAVTAQFEIILLTSKLSRHTQCLDRDSRASVLVTGTLPPTGDPLTAFRATLTGTCMRTNDPQLRATYLAMHPYAELYAGFSDFGFWRMLPDKLYIVAGFGRVFNYDACEMIAP
jgi:hypothetical protein